MTNGIELTISDALITDAGRGIARLDAKSRTLLAVNSGDVVEIKGKTKSTAAVVWQAHPSDEGLGFIRIDGYLRQNIGVGIGDKVFVSKAEVKEADRVVIAPPMGQRPPLSPEFGELAKRRLENRPVVKGDSIPVSMFGLVFNFIVVQVSPHGVVRITRETNLIVKEEPVSESEVRIADVHYEDIGGLRGEIQKIREMVEYPIRYPELFERLGIQAPKGVLIYGPPGCIVGDSLIALENGGLARIDEIARNMLPGVYVADLPIYPPASAKALHVYDVPETIEVVTETGKRLRMTTNHPLMTESGWKKAEELNTRDKIKVFRWLPSPVQYVQLTESVDNKRLHKKIELPKLWDEKLGELFGVFIAEGTAGRDRVFFTIESHEDELAKAVLSNIKSLFDMDGYIAPKKGKNCNVLRFDNRGLADFFRKFWSRENKRVPAPILMSPNSVVASFIRGLFEGDGYVRGANKYHGIFLKSKSRKLTEEVQTLLLRFAITSRIYDSSYLTEKGERKRIHILTIRGKNYISRFNDGIGFISARKKGLLKRVVEGYRRNLDFLKDDFERIRTINKIGEWQRVYDFEVPKTHSFFSNGILSHNTGKTLLAKAVANESDAHFIAISGPELVSKFVGESEEKLREIFKEANEKAPSIIFMDEIDAIAPKREEATNEVERRMVSQLLTLLDGMPKRGQVIVVAATNRQDAVDPALRRPGRFDREIEIGVPDRNSRKEILQIHTKDMPLAKDVSVDELANITHGYTGADISALGKEAAMISLRTVWPKIIDKKKIPEELLLSLSVSRDNFMEALKSIRPSAMREVFVERPNVHWNDIGDMEQAKEDVKEAVELPLKDPQVFEKIGIRPMKGILIVGPPGTGKTLLARAVATEREANFISIKGPEILSKFVGESERTVREIFRKARQAAPCIIFIDEIDAIARSRGSGYLDSGVSERVVDTLLTELDGLQDLKNVVVLAATNRPEDIDPAMLRPGRFDKIIEILMPGEGARLEIFKVHTKRMPLDKDVDLVELAKETDEYTGAEIENIVREAGMNAIRNKRDIVKKDDFMKALQEVRPAIPKEVAERIKRFKEEPESMYR